MKNLKRLLLVVTVVAATIVPATGAGAAHRCGLEDVDPLVNALCEWHPGQDPSDIKRIINFVACTVLPSC